ncbi:helix-turn-helix domain-containing protein [Clostridium gasigenes]|uniref:helix-turn-helix domain-containing protein n=1 Tax=Clostridium gasigenes TaxID=94869 RepID=UPI001C0E68BB|nr:AraC family transcriptional regulator [Clostridium gasigenes]MBU3107445.1 helix-turn-helix domain-containing protein [Clostridium gasigenes]
MNRKENIIDLYYKYLEEEFNCRTSDELLGKKYIIGQQFGVGNFSRMKLEEGIEISKLKFNKADLYFDNRTYDDNILELGYCYSGCGKILSLPDNKEYIIKEEDIFIYKTINDVDYFKFTYNNCKTISINMNFNTIENVISPIWKDKSIEDWQNNINRIFKEDILIIKKATYQMKKIAEEIDFISTDNIMGLMKLKLKTIEFLCAIFEENSSGEKLNNIKLKEEEIVTKVQDIIKKNIGNVLTIKKIVSDLNISSYKLQEAFKNITGDTVYKYIKKAKIQKAEYLLKNTDMSILEVANEIGYENPSKFSSLFKEYNNITPLKYRKIKYE